MMSMKVKVFLKSRELVDNIGVRHVSDYYTRPMTVFAKEHFKDSGKLTVVEIGCSSGYNARNICENLNIEKLYCIDPYTTYFDKFERSDAPAFSTAKKTLKNYPVVFIKKYSAEAVNYIPNNLDSCYIDGNHRFKNVKQDIELYYPKIRQGGIIGGHDFEGTCLGVVRAVLEFADKNNLELHTDKTDWWMIKK